MLTPLVVGQRHYKVAQEVRRNLAEYEELKDIIAMLGLEELSQEDRKVVNRARRLERFMTQPFVTTEQFTGYSGKVVDLEDALDGCERILNDEFAERSEGDLYMLGKISDIKSKAGSGKESSSQGSEEGKEEEREETAEVEQEETSENEQDQASENEEKDSDRE